MGHLNCYQLCPLSMFLTSSSVQNLLTMPQAWLALSCLCSGSFLYLEILSLPHYQFPLTEIFPSHQYQTSIVLKKESVVILPPSSDLVLVSSFVISFCCSHCEYFIKAYLWVAFLTTLSDELSCLFSWSMRFWGFQPNLPISGEKLNVITSLTIARRRWHSGVWGMGSCLPRSFCMQSRQAVAWWRLPLRENPATSWLVLKKQN